jgi:hypothetical protein
VPHAPRQIHDRSDLRTRAHQLAAKSSPGLADVTLIRQRLQTEAGTMGGDQGGALDRSMLYFDLLVREAEVNVRTSAAAPPGMDLAARQQLLEAMMQKVEEATRMMTNLSRASHEAAQKAIRNVRA